MTSIPEFASVLPLMSDRRLDLVVDHLTLYRPLAWLEFKLFLSVAENGGSGSMGGGRWGVNSFCPLRIISIVNSESSEQRERDRERERDRQTDRYTDRQAGRRTD